MAEAEKVLIADNDDQVVEVMAAFLVRQGLAVETVRDGAAALARLEKGGIALLVCDLDMPRMSGEDLLDRLRDRAGVPPVVVISGWVDERLARALQRHPAVARVLRKPFDLAPFARDAAALVRAPEGAARPREQGLFG